MDQRIQLTIQLIENEFSQALTSKKLARRVNLSASRLGHLFKVETGSTVAQFLLSVRLRKARGLLEETYLSVKEIMNLVGISDSSHFARAFKREYGLPPSEYRLAKSRRPTSRSS